MNHAIYVHIPFCTHRCAYCDFNTYAHQEDSIPAYVDALIREIQYVGREAGRRRNGILVHTVFFGGGTPTLLSGPQLAAVVDALRGAFAFSADAEITSEANPGTVSAESLAAMRAAGFNRISFGVQSANHEELHMLERQHNFFDVIAAVSSARRAGFDNLNLDVIYGLPEQSMHTWMATLARIAELAPEHVSAYALTLEHGTPFGRWAARGLLPLPDPDLAAEMYEFAEEFLSQHRFVQYEISNWALEREPRMPDDPATSPVIPVPSFACRHNLQYWRSLPYLAFGAGAHGYAQGFRYSNALRIKTYIDRIVNFESGAPLPFPLSPAAVNHHQQSRADDISDYMLNNLRLTNAGVAESDFSSRFGSTLSQTYPKEIEELIRLGLLERKTSAQSEVFALSKRGRLLGNQVFMRFVS